MVKNQQFTQSNHEVGLTTTHVSVKNDSFVLNTLCKLFHPYRCSGLNLVIRFVNPLKITNGFVSMSSGNPRTIEDINTVRQFLTPTSTRSPYSIYLFSNHTTFTARACSHACTNGCMGKPFFGFQYVSMTRTRFTINIWGWIKMTHIETPFKRFHNSCA